MTMTDPGDQIRGRRRSTRIAIALGLLIAAGVVVAAVVIANNASSPTSKDTPGKVTGATTVQRRNLVETDTESGTLSYADPQTVYNRLDGTVTWLPSIGATIKSGQALYRVDGEPVVLLNGTTPAYRKLDSSDSAGPDILELNEALIALGYSGYGIVADDEWQAATTNAVDAFQESQGEKASGKLGLGQVVFLPGPQLISTVDATLGQAGGGSESPPASNADTTVDPPAPEYVSLSHVVSVETTGATGATGTTGTTGTLPQTHTPSTKHLTGPQTLAALEALLKAQLQELRASEHSGSPSSKSPSSKSPSSKSPSSKSPSSKSPSSGSPKTGSSTPQTGSGSPSGGGGGGSATAILATSSAKLVVTVDLSASSQSEAVVGEPVTVEMPAGNTVNGKITAVSPVAQTPSSSDNGTGGSGGGGGGGGSSSTSTIPVTVTLKGHHTGDGLDEATVSVNFAEARAKHVLSVPVTALLATSGSSYAVQAAAAPHKLIPVTVGLFAAGYVQISGSGIYPGLSVTDSQG
jgi:hypothetical protein